MVKKNTIKKALCLAAAAALMLAGCADKNIPAEAVTSTAKTTQAETAAPKTVASKSETAVKPFKSDIQGLAVDFNYESGFYDKPIVLQMYCPEKGAKIYYTTDGSVPDEKSTLYTAPITLKNRKSANNVLSAQTGTSAGGDYIPKKNVDKANVIRAVAIKPDGSKSEIVNGTYFVGIDREKKYGDVPVISIMTDKDNLFNYNTGIYVLGKTYDEWKAKQTKHFESWEAVGNYSQKGKEWERPAVIQLIEPDGDVGFTQDMGIKIKGAASRGATQKSFTVTAREEYGKKSVKYELIPDNMRSDGSGEVEKYKSFVLRNGGNDCDFAKVRDPLLQKLVSSRRLDTMQSIPVVVYIDGEYWGMYTLAEEYSDNYIENNYGIDNNNVVIVKRGELDEGQDKDIELYNNMYDFIVGNDMSSDANYKRACEMLDMGSYADYCAFNLYIYNQDTIFDGNNWSMWRVRTPDKSSSYADGKWRMLVYDTDYSSGIYNDGANYKDDNISKVIGDGTVNADNGWRSPVEMFRSLYRNPDFKQELVTAMCDIRNVEFNSSSAINELSEMAEIYEKLVPPTFERFGPDWIARYNTAEYYHSKIDQLATFLDGRYRHFPEIMKKTMGLGDMANVEISLSEGSKSGIVINNSAPDMSGTFKGKYCTDYPITLTAVPAKGEKFVRWEYSGCSVSNPNSAKVTVRFGKDLTIKAVFEKE